MTRSEGPPHFTDRMIATADDMRAPETVSADTLPSYRADIKITRMGDTIVSATLYGPAEFLATSVGVIADAFRDEVGR